MMNAARKDSVGRRFSRREVEITKNENGEVHTEAIDWDDVWNARTMERHRDSARAILEAEGIDVARLLDDSPHGSALREHVLNRLGREPDSRAGLAARIYELCAHALAYQRMEGGHKLLSGLMARLGRLTQLLKVYQIENIGYAKGGKKTAIANKRAAADQNKKLKAAAQTILKNNPRLSNSDLARVLAERRGLGGGQEAIRKKLPRILPRKK